MAKKTLSRWQKAVVLVPLAAASGAWTATLAVPADSDTDTLQATSSEAAASTEGSGMLPDGTSVPTQAIEAPASVSSPDSFGSGGYDGSVARSITADSSINGIPSAAVAAYQRAAQVINAADSACNISWQLVAAIGRVESDHGRYGGNVLTADGVARPGIYGIPLDGTNGTARIADTDGGEFDNDAVWDRAMGPMQFIPSTWSIVGVDSDGDGERNPQDIDDAALATAVYLCSGGEDLSTEQGQRSAVFRYNRSNDYVDLVLSLMRAYQAGDFTTTPNEVYSGATFFPAPSDSVVTKQTKGKPKKAKNVPEPKPKPTRNGGGSGGLFGGGGSSGGSGGSGGGVVTGGETGGGSVGDTVKETTENVGGTVKDATKNVQETVEDTLTPLQKAQEYCRNTDTGPASLQQCVDAYLSGGASAVNNLVSGLLDTTKGAVDGVKGTVGGVVGGLTGGN
ncbi:lytic transglycosylase domain-containing protein [Nocardioidaceae bacterium]|nr:lytic transglycosylase domain-containing protein [Nocardioidaceae bacterium]